MSEPIFYCKCGLTRYALACGYVDRRTAYGRYKELYMEHEHFHVRTGPIGERYEVWETFSNDELTKARKYFEQIDLRPWQSETFLFLSEALKFQRRKQREGYSTKLEKHSGANPFSHVKFFI